MENIKIHKKSFKTALLAFIVLLCGAALLSYPEQVTDGARKGLSICSSVLIPSLFPFLVLSGFMSSPILARPLAKIMKPFTQLLFALPGECGTTIILGAVGGFPVGARMTAELYGSGQISKRHAHTLLTFCVNAGPAFVITAVGTVMLGSKEAGFIIFAAASLSMLLIGIIQGLFSERIGLSKTAVRHSKNDESAAGAFTSSVSGAAAATLSICAWMILFSCVISVLECIIKNPLAAKAISLFAEVTAGAASSAKAGDMALITAVIGFSGICVHCQIIPYIQAVGMSYAKFFVWRIINSALSYIMTKTLLIFFPCNIVVSASTDAFYKSFSVSVPATITLLFMCAVLIVATNQEQRTIS